MDSTEDFNDSTRRALFGPKGEIPGKGTSAARDASRYIRTKITINLDQDIIERFKERAKVEGLGYQILINRALRDYLDGGADEQMALRVGKMLLEDGTFLERISEKVR